MLKFQLNGKEIKMEHSLVAISNWESVFKVPFLTRKEFKGAEFLFYLESMCIDCSLTSEDIIALSKNPDYISLINDYMNDTRTATYVKNLGNKSSITMTSEVIYAYMAILGIDFCTDTWHIQRLLKLIEVISELTGEKKKMSQEEIMQEKIRLNQERREKYNSKG